MVAKRVRTPAPPDRPGVSGTGRLEVPATPRVSLTPSGRKRAAAVGPQRRTSPVGKPYPAFPLTPHPSGQFCKKIRGKLFYFGSVADSEAALERYHRHCQGLHSGQTTRIGCADELTVARLANKFLAAKERKREAGNIEAATFVEYHRDCELMVSHFGRARSVASITRKDLGAFREFLGRGVNATTLNNRVGNAGSIFTFAYEDELIEKPVRFGEEFRRPERRILPRARARGGRLHFQASEIRGILDAGPPVLRAKILLGINAGLGNTDLGRLPASCINLDRGWLDYARVKTGIDRRCPLWPETIDAVRAAVVSMAACKRARDPSAQGLLFVTRNGMPYTREVFHADKNGQADRSLVALPISQAAADQECAQGSLPRGRSWRGWWTQSAENCGQKTPGILAATGWHTVCSLSQTSQLPRFPIPPPCQPSLPPTSEKISCGGIDAPAEIAGTL